MTRNAARAPANPLRATVDIQPRRRVLKAAAAAALGTLGAPALVRAQSTPPIRIGFWPVASGLPFFVALTRAISRKPA